MRQGLVKAAIVAVAAVAVFITVWVLWPRPAPVPAPQARQYLKANPGRRFVLVAASTTAGPAVVPPNAVVVPAADASGRIDQEVSALAGTA